jgi:DNA-binding LytR/AlgR family response regulator
MLIGVAVATLALWFTFRDRGPWETAGGAVALGLAISAMHYGAMMATDFLSAGDVAVPPGPALTQHNLAFIVAIATFLICSMFLLIALPDQKRDGEVAVAASPVHAPPPDPGEPAFLAAPSSPARIPVRRNQSIFFAAPETILAVRAEGHYSWISLRADSGEIAEYFCERSISTLAKLLTAPRFVRSHRSYLVNIAHVSSFRRQGDGGILLLAAQGDISVPVSRSNIRQVLALLERSNGQDSGMPQAATA